MLVGHVAIGRLHPLVEPVAFDGVVAARTPIDAGSVTGQPGPGSPAPDAFRHRRRVARMTRASSAGEFARANPRTTVDPAAATASLVNGHDEHDGTRSDCRGASRLEA